MKEARDSQTLGTKKINQLLISLSTPAFIAMLVSGIYSIVDTIFIGKGINAKAIGAIGIVYPIQTLYTAFAQMISIGCASSIARSLGEQNNERANQIATNAYSLTIIISLILMLISFIYSDKILYLFGSNEELIDHAKEYFFISIWAIPFNALTLLASAVFRAEGNMRTSMVIILIGAIFNIILDPLLIFTFNLNLSGAAWATVISQALATAFSLFLILSHRSIVKMERRFLSPNLKAITSIIGVGFSAFARNAASSLFALITNFTLRSLGGTVSLTAFGTVNRIISLFFLPIMGINQGLQPITSYNYGARNPERIRQAIKLALIYTTIIGAIGSITGFLFPQFLVKLFTKETNLISQTTFVLKLQLFFFWTIGLQTITTTFYQALGRAIPALFLSMLRQFIILVPLILILPHFTKLGLNGVWYAFPISDLAAFLICAFVLRKSWLHLKTK